MNWMRVSLSASVMIGAVLVLRGLGLARLPKAAFPLLWDLVLLRLFTPFYYTLPALPGPAFPAAKTGSGALGLLWLAGAAAVALFFVIPHLAARREYRCALPVENAFVRDWARRNPLRRPLQIRRSDRADAPLTYGLLRPVILLPAALEEAPKERLEFVLAHELAHVRRFDVAAKWALAAALSLYWFHPLVWALYVFANRDLELACDEAVLRRLGEDRRPAYARTLVALAHGRSAPPLAGRFGGSEMKERIVMVMRMGKTGWCATAVVLAAACCLALAGFARAGQRAAPPAAPPYGQAEERGGLEPDTGTQADYLPEYRSEGNRGVTPQNPVDAEPEYVDNGEPAGAVDGDYEVSYVPG